MTLERNARRILQASAIVLATGLAIGLAAGPSLAGSSFFADESRIPGIRAAHAPGDAAPERHPYGFWRDLERTRRTTAVNALERGSLRSQVERTARPPAPGTDRSAGADVDL